MALGRGGSAPELWSGADVVWAGPADDALGVRPGDRAVVVDAGRYQLRAFSSFSVLWFGNEPPRPPRGVLIEFGDGRRIDVAREQLEFVAPEHPLAPEPHATWADWFLSELADWGRGEPLTVASFVPRSLPSVCIVVHPAGSVGQLDRETAAALIDALTPATSTPDDVFFAVWEGWGDQPAQRFPGAARVRVPHREHFLLRGPLVGALTSISIAGRNEPVSGIWWPRDRSWLVVTEIDFSWTFVAGGSDLVASLAARPDLRTRAAGFDDVGNRLDP